MILLEVKKRKRLAAWLIGGLLALGFALLSAVTRTPAAGDADEPQAETIKEEAPCPPGSLPDRDVCVPVPLRPADVSPEAPTEQ